MPAVTSLLRRLSRPAGWILIAFTLSRVLAVALGMRFDMAPLGYFYQYLPVVLLKTRLAESLWNLHAQPPAYNLFLGWVLKAAGDHAAIAFHLVYLGLGLTFAYALFGLLGRLGLSAKAAALWAIAFSVSPAALLYETWLFYTYPVATALCLAAWGVAVYADRPRFRLGLGVFALLAFVAFTRSLYHPVWLAAIAFGLAWAVRRRPGAVKTTLLAAALPLALVLALYAKNYALFGTFSGSSWLGMSLAKPTLGQLYGPEKVDLYRRGLIAETSMYPPYHGLEEYPKSLVRPAPTGVPALDELYKPGGYINYNHLAYVALSKQYQKDAVTCIKAYPARYLSNVGKTTLISLRPATDNTFFTANRRAIGPYVDGVEALQLTLGNGVPEPVRHVAIALTIGFPLLLGWGLYQGFRRGNPALLFLCFNILFVTLVGNLVETGENNRFRFEIDAFYWALAALLVRDLLQRVKGRGFTK